LTDASGTPTTYPATIIGKDASHDLAVLSIDMGGDEWDQLVPLPVGSSSELKVRWDEGLVPGHEGAGWN
jgi:S1-C subfamily serine protease